MRYGQKKWLVILGNCATIAVVFIWLFPVYWMVLNSFKSPTDIVSRVPLFFFSPTLVNYQDIFASYNFADVLQHSLIICIVSTLITVILAIPAAYTLGRIRTKVSNNLALWILSLRFLPAVAVVIPWYILATKLNIIDSYGVMILVYVAISLPFAVWLLRGFFADIPLELDQAAMLDGYRQFDIMRKIIVPLGTPSIAVTAMFTFIFSWNEFLLALILTDTNAVTIPVQMSKMVLAYQVLWGQLSAAGVIALIPPLIMVFLLQNNIVRGLTLGAVK